MASTFFGLDIGLSGIYAANAHLTTTAHNIANAETDGYTRQQVTTKGSKALHTYTTYGMIGTGVEVTGVEQTRSIYYDEKYWKTNTLEGEYGTKSYYMKSIENYFNELNDDGFSKTFDNMYNALSELANEPSSLEKREQVTQISHTFTDYFNYMTKSLEQIQDDLNFEIKNTVDTINNIAEEISTLNLKINTLEVTGFSANDLRDQRSLLIDKLSNLCSVSVEEDIFNKDEDNYGQTSYIVKIDGQILVDTYKYNTLVCEPRDEKDNQNDIDGLYEVSWLTDKYGGQSFKMHSQSLGGVFQSLVEMRDGNNLENLRGSVVASKGDTQVTLTDTTINSINKLNIPETGYITFGGKEYKYTGFTVNITKNASGGEDKYEYVFDLEESVEEDINTKNAHIGNNIDYKGVSFYMAQLNEFVRTFADKFNSICNEGQDLNGDAGGDFFKYKDKVTGKQNSLQEYDEITSFTSSSFSYYKMTSGNICVSQEIADYPEKFPAADDIDMGVENNVKIRELVALKSDITMFKQGKPAAFLQTLVSEIGVDAAAADQFATNQEKILKTIENQRLSLSGVDSDEEAMNLIVYQRMYQLNSKVISIMNEVLGKLVNEFGL